MTIETSVGAAPAFTIDPAFAVFSHQNPLNELRQRTQAGAGWLLLDSSLYTEHLEAVTAMVSECGRNVQLLVLDFDAPHDSHSIDIMAGEPTDVAATLAGLLPDAPNDDAGAGFYRVGATNALEVLAEASKAAGMHLRLRDISNLLQSAEALQKLKACVPTDTPAHGRLNDLLDSFRPAPGVEIDVAQLRTALGGLAGRIAQFAQGALGATFDSAVPSARFSDIVEGDLMLYVRLPAGEALAKQIARVISTGLSRAVQARRA